MKVVKRISQRELITEFAFVHCSGTPFCWIIQKHMKDSVQELKALMNVKNT